MSFSPQPFRKKILIPQKRIDAAHAPYIAVADKYGLSIDFHPFTSIASVPVPEFRKYKQDILHKRSAFLFTNKIAVDHFFKLTEDIKARPSEDTRYFCATEQLKNYLQKYIQMKQRKVAHGIKSIEDTFPKIKKFKDLHFLFPCSNTRKKSLYDFFKKNGLSYKEIPTYQAKVNDLSSLRHDAYDVILFFSPLEVKAMETHFPTFNTTDVRVAVFGQVTAKAVQEAGWEAHIQAPSVEAPSLADALDVYFKAKMNG